VAWASECQAHRIRPRTRKLKTIRWEGKPSSTIGRSATGVISPKLREIIHKDLWNYASIETQPADFEACFFCPGVTSAGMNEADDTHITDDLTMATADVLVRLNPGMTFVFVSACGREPPPTASCTRSRRR
jgi:hypothetical protein